MMSLLRNLYANTNDPAVAKQLSILAVRSLLPLAELIQRRLKVTKGIEADRLDVELIRRIARIEREAIAGE